MGNHFTLHTLNKMNEESSQMFVKNWLLSCSSSTEKNANLISKNVREEAEKQLILKLKSLEEKHLITSNAILTCPAYSIQRNNSR